MLSLKDYDISARYGFIPDGPLVDTLSEYYSPWELVISDLPRLVTTRKIRNVIDNLPILSMDRLLHESEWQRSYTILSFLSNAYIWGGDLPKEV
jgi:indoleamine 2,3-dioxygenase